MVRGGVDTSWMFYTPYSTLYSNSDVVVTVVGFFITRFSSILTGLNFIVTIHDARPGHDLVPPAAPAHRPLPPVLDTVWVRLTVGGRKWKGEGASRPSPQSPKGILGSPSPMGPGNSTPYTKGNSL